LNSSITLFSRSLKAIKWLSRDEFNIEHEVKDSIAFDHDKMVEQAMTYIFAYELYKKKPNNILPCFTP